MSEAQMLSDCRSAPVGLQECGNDSLSLPAVATRLQLYWKCVRIKLI